MTEAFDARPWRRQVSAGAKRWEHETNPVFCDLAKKADLVLDVGAFTGVYTLLACAANPKSKVVAFEPVPRVREQLIENIRLNHGDLRCEVRPEAVSDYVGSSELHVPYGPLPSFSSLHKGGFRGADGQLLEVPVTTLDAACEGRGQVDLVKIDVEGFELQVLLGMRQILKESSPALILEVNLDNPVGEIQALLSRVGYTFYHIRANGPALTREITPDPNETYRNVLCLPARGRDRWGELPYL